MVFKIDEVLLFFAAYAIMGWISEVIFAALKTGRFVNRGFLNGPLCPIYGFGVVAVVLALEPVKDSLILLFLGSFVLTTALEFLRIFAVPRFKMVPGKFQLMLESLVGLFKGAL